MTIRNHIISSLSSEIERCETELEKRKNNINSNYTLAKLDFIVIDNYTDSLEVYKNIREQLVELQKRIVARNER